MAIPSALLKSIYVAYALGNEGDKIGYTEPMKIYAQTENVTSAVVRDKVGIVIDYDRLILVPFGENTQFINEQSLLWIGVQPNAKRNNMDYGIERVGDVVDGNFVVYCKSLTNNYKPLYYEYGGKIYQTKLDFDKDTLTALVPFNKYLPINAKTKVWLTKPTNSESITNLIKLVLKKQLDKSYKLVFERVSTND
jgi:hypothetical protein